jgi:hypothetical protein
LAASWLYCGEDPNEAKAVGGAAAFSFIQTAAHLAGLGGIYASHAYTAQAIREGLARGRLPS